MTGTIVKRPEQLNKWEDLLCPVSERSYYYDWAVPYRILYDAILKGIIDCRDHIDVPDGITPLDNNKVGAVYHCILWDNPAVFCIGEYAMWEALYDNGRKIKITSLYSPDSYIRNIRSQILSEVKKILSYKGLYEMGDIQKELYVHDYIIRNVSYDRSFGNGKLNPYTVYGAVVDKLAVCEGISKLAKLLLNCLGIPAQVVSGNITRIKGSSGHSWNTVMIDGKSYHLDVTSDMARTVETQEKLLRRDYFNLSDTVLLRENEIKRDSVVWKCDSYKANYAYITGGYISNKEELRKILAEKISRRIKLIYIRLNKKTLGNVNAKDWINSVYVHIPGEVGVNVKRAVFEWTSLNGLVVMRFEY